jgi:hypothetical protein
MFKNSSSVILDYSLCCGGFANPAPAAAGGVPGPGCPLQPLTRFLAPIDCLKIPALYSSSILFDVEVLLTLPQLLLVVCLGLAILGSLLLGS